MYSAVVVQEVLQRRREPWGRGVQWPAIGSWHGQSRGSSKLILLQLHKKLLKNSVSTVLQSFSIQSKLERWKSSISECLTSWPKILKNCHFGMLSSILYNNNEPFLHRIVACDQKWILFNNQRWPAQWLDQEEAPKHFPKLTYTKKDHDRCLVACCPSDPLQLSQSQRSHYIWEVCSADRWDLQRLQPALINRKGPILLQDTPWPHVTQPVLQKLNKLGYAVLPHLPYSPNLSSVNYYFFKHLDNFLQGKCFLSQRQKMLSKGSLDKSTYFSVAKMGW